MTIQYIWGFAGGQWHALTRHDPHYDNQKVKSERLTQQAIAKAKRRKVDVDAVLAERPDAFDVYYNQARGKAPGHGNTLCGMDGLSLDSTNESAEGIGVDPDPTTDSLCPVCRHKAQLA